MKIGQTQRHLSGKGVTVAVIDESIDTHAPELRGQHVSLGPDCFGEKTTSKPGSYNDHGTSMASYVVGSGHGMGPDGAGVRGVAPGARLRFFGLDTQPPADLDCGPSGLATEINSAVRAGADIVSMSVAFSGGGSALEHAVRHAIEHGVVLVAASGDTAGKNAMPQIGYPAAVPGVVAVNAVDRKARPWSTNPPPTFTDYRTSFPVISAPGVHVNAMGWLGGWDSTGWVTGTSPATAIVAGCLALVKQKYPDATGNQLVQDLIHFTGGSRKYYWDPKYGFGITSLPDMLNHDPTKWPNVNPLLHGPKAAMKDFPMSSYGKAQVDGSTSGKASASPSVAAAGKSGKTGKTGNTLGTQSGGSDGGVPPWVWVIVAVVVLGGAGGTATMMKKRGRAAPGAGTGRV
ncbi:MAG: S8 family peptidase [Sciscionella sp.]